jgi:hypothetical protein
MATGFMYPVQIFVIALEGRLVFVDGFITGCTGKDLWLIDVGRGLR